MNIRSFVFSLNKEPNIILVIPTNWVFVFVKVDHRCMSMNKNNSEEKISSDLVTFQVSVLYFCYFCFKRRK